MKHLINVLNSPPQDNNDVIAADRKSMYLMNVVALDRILKCIFIDVKQLENC